MEGEWRAAAMSVPPPRALCYNYSGPRALVYALQSYKTISVLSLVHNEVTKLNCKVLLY